MTFSYFLQLPLEIRRMIWHFCLPRRVVEPCGLGKSQAYLDCSQCECWNSNPANERRPQIASVCREAAQVVRATGLNITAYDDVTEDEDGDPMEMSPSWVQPSVDIAIQMPLYFKDDDDEGPEGNGIIEDYDIAELFALAREVKMDASPTVMNLGYYELEKDYTRPETLQFQVPTDISASRVWSSLPDIASFLTDERSATRSLIVPLCSIFLCTTPKVMRASGLFGLLGDATTQYVDINDTKRLGAFRDFSTYYYHPTARNATNAFHEILHPSFPARVQAWTHYFDFKMFAYLWSKHLEHLSKDTSNQHVLQNFYAVWTPPYKPGQESFHHAIHAVDELHPWVIQTRRLMSRIKYTICISACLSNSEECESKYKLNSLK